MKFIKKTETLSLLLILVLASFLRFYNIMHDSPYFFNPDERNMAVAVTRFILPAKLSSIPLCLLSEFSPETINAGRSYTPDADGCSLNPHFFAYGQFPLYLSFISDQITKPVASLFNTELVVNSSRLTTDFPSAVYWLRFWSAVTSVLTVLMVYLIAKKLLSGYIPLLVALITVFVPGLIQSSHFGTTESLLTLFFLTSLYWSFDLFRINNFGKKIPVGKIVIISFLIALSIGLSLGSKLTGLIFLFPPCLTLMLSLIKNLKIKFKKKPPYIGKITPDWQCLLNLVFIGIFLTGLIGIIFVLSSPYNLVEFTNFKSAVFGYERDVALGKYEAFYTRQFVDSVPFLFQIRKVFPYALGWPVFISGLLGFVILLLVTISSLFTRTAKKFMKNESGIHLIILSFSFLVYIIPNAVLFAKWTRFMTPVFPFFVLFTGFLFNFFVEKKFVSFRILTVLTFLCLLPGLAFVSIYAEKDTREEASEWIYQSLPSRSYILSETANVVDIPLGLPPERSAIPNRDFTVISFDFYHLDERGQLYLELLKHLEQADYIFIPSRRIFKNHTRMPQQYKLTTKYYQLLFSGALGFEKIMEFSSYPGLTLGPFNLVFPDEDAEETFTVFDHPVIRIYKKIRPLSINKYNSLFQNDN